MDHPIRKGTLVHVTPFSEPGRRTSDGGIGTVVKRRKKLVNEEGNTVILTQDSDMSTLTGNSIYNIKYTVEGRLSQDVQKDRVEIANLALNARRRSANDETQPSILTPSHHLTSAVSSTQTTHISSTSKTPKKYSHAWLTMMRKGKLR